MEEKKLRRTALFAFLITGLTGTLLHFVYEWSGGSTIAALFSGVNESTWEHMKLLFVPMALLSVVGYQLLGRRYPSYWISYALSTLLGLLLIPTLYYTYTGILGQSLIAVDIGIFYLSAFLAYLFLYRSLLFNRFRGNGLNLLGIVLLLLFAGAFVFFTFSPPKLGLFLSPNTGTYGIPLLTPASYLV